MHTLSAPTPLVDPPHRLSARHIPALDGLRGLAILAVLVFKASEGFAPQTWAGKAVAQVSGAGWAGVDLFFVLSGFLISGILLDTKASPHFFRNFYARRTLRVFPLYYGVLLVTFLLLGRHAADAGPAAARIVYNQGWLWTYTTNIAFLVKRSVFFDAGWLRFNHFWSLAIEEQFYLVWPLLVYVLSRRRITALCGLMVAGALALRLTLYFLHQKGGAMFYPTPCRTDSLAVGALLAIAMRSNVPAMARHLWARRVAIVTASILVAVWCWRGKLDVNDVTTLTFGFTVLAAFAGAILMLAIPPAPSTGWARTLEWRPLRLVGKYSYAMYVLHMLVITALDRRWTIDWFVARAHSEAAGMLAHAAVYCVVTTGAGFLSWHLFEKHFLSAKRFFADRGATASVAAFSPAGAPLPAVAATRADLLQV